MVRKGELTLGKQRALRTTEIAEALHLTEGEMKIVQLSPRRLDQATRIATAMVNAENKARWFKIALYRAHCPRYDPSLQYPPFQEYLDSLPFGKRKTFTNGRNN
jgi:hypothetical protein